MDNIIKDKVETIISKLSEISDDASNVLQEAQDAFYDLSEELQDSDRGDEMENLIDCLEDAIGNIEETMVILGDAI